MLKLTYTKQRPTNRRALSLLMVSTREGSGMGTDLSSTILRTVVNRQPAVPVWLLYQVWNRYCSLMKYCLSFNLHLIGSASSKVALS